MFINMQKFIENVSGEEVYTETLLWENSAPTSSFAELTITLDDDMSNYDAIRIYSKASTTATEIFWAEQDSKNWTNMCCVKTAVVSGIGYTRQITSPSSNQLKFWGAYAFNQSASNNAYCIPTKITGLKKESSSIAGNINFIDVQVATANGYTFTRGAKKVIVCTMSGADRRDCCLLNGNLPVQQYYSSNSSQSSIYLNSYVFENVKAGDELSYTLGSSWATTIIFID